MLFDKFLIFSAKQILENSEAIDDFTFASRAHKLTSQEDDFKEINENALESLQTLLSLQRVAFDNKIARGVLESDMHRVRLESNVGLKNMGYFVNQINYLRPHEALYCLEMNKLRVTFDDVVMSLEQSFEIFLSCDNAMCLEEYLVYSNLMRSGYNVKLYNPDMSIVIPAGYKVQISKQNEMVWQVLKRRLKLTHSEVSEEDRNLFELTKVHMDENFKTISGRDYEEVSEPPSKRLRVDGISESHFVDVLKFEDKFQSYSDILSKFDFIQRHQTTAHENQIRNLAFNFDVFAAKQSTEGIPSYRILVVKSKDNFPSNIELDRLKSQQKYQTISVIAIVSESLSIHFCIYNV